MKDRNTAPECDLKNPKPIQLSSGLAELLDEYSIEVLEAALDILRVRSKKKAIDHHDPNHSSFAHKN